MDDAAAIMDEREHATGLRSCLTYALALACDAVYLDGTKAFAAIDVASSSVGVDAVVQALMEKPETFGRLKNRTRCALAGMTREQMRLMVMQLFLFRKMQEAKIKTEWPLH